MRSALARALRSEAATDSFSNCAPLRWCVVGFLIAYLAVIVSRPSTTSESLVYASPEGLQMTLSKPFNGVFMAIHFYAGAALIVLALLVKFSAVSVSTSGGRRGRRLHRAAGYVTLAAVAFMAVGGFSLRHNSSFSGFSTAMILFVAPWALFLAVVPGSILIAKASQGRVQTAAALTHVIAGNATFKACCAVPLARVLGVALQCVTEKLEEGYYVGIASSAVVIGFWAVLDAVKLINHFAVSS